MKFHRLVLASIVVVAVLAGCGKSSSPTSATVPSLDNTPPPVPQALATDMDASSHQQVLTWDASPAPDVVGYEIYSYSPDPSRLDSYVFLDYTTQPRWNVTGVTQSTANHYRVRAVDEAGNRSGFTSDLLVEIASSQQSVPPPEPTGPPTHKGTIE